MFSDYQQRLRERYLAAPVMPAPAPWHPVLTGRTPIGSLQGIGFAPHPADDRDLVMVVSTAGHGVFDTHTGQRIARDRDPDPDTSTPDESPELTCPGLGPLTGMQVPIAGLFAGGLHTTTSDGWKLEVIAPSWPHHHFALQWTVASTTVHSMSCRIQFWKSFQEDSEEFGRALLIELDCLADLFI